MNGEHISAIPKHPRLAWPCAGAELPQSSTQGHVQHAVIIPLCSSISHTWLCAILSHHVQQHPCHRHNCCLREFQKERVSLLPLPGAFLSTGAAAAAA